MNDILSGIRVIELASWSFVPRPAPYWPTGRGRHQDRASGDR
ncbi:L-carnitine dehydratase/bile acid-inducible F domain protein [Mycobacterium xenopi 3993]|nr:L-carnitine dehydratase/bile acid-inducible F domain protein [Mycobacterium xenopi 3993]